MGGAHAGYHVDPVRLVNDAVFDVTYDEMVVVRSIDYYSMHASIICCRFWALSCRLHPQWQGDRAKQDPRMWRCMPGGCRFRSR